MEMDIAKLATAQISEQTSVAVSVAILKQAQNAAGSEALELLESISQAPSASGVGEVVDISA